MFKGDCTLSLAELYGEGLIFEPLSEPTPQSAPLTDALPRTPPRRVNGQLDLRGDGKVE